MSYKYNLHLPNVIFIPPAPLIGRSKIFPLISYLPITSTLGAVKITSMVCFSRSTLKIFKFVVNYFTYAWFYKYKSITRYIGMNRLVLFKHFLMYLNYILYQLNKKFVATEWFGTIETKWNTCQTVKYFIWLQVCLR